MARIDSAAAPDVVIASSSSSLLPSDYQQDAAHPSRILAAHPFNPPSLVPLVEVAGGVLTDPDAVDWALAFFRHVGKRPIHVKREQPGLVANRMTAALFREAVDLVASGVASVEDVDAAICHGPGLRWAVMGPHLLYHLGGGAGGYRHYLDHLGPSQEARWASLRTTALTPDVRQRLIEGVEAELGALGLTAPEQRRDAAMADILAALGALPSPEKS
jgi:3-hydroxyacyl-CoA dehydrogenase